LGQKSPKDLLKKKKENKGLDLLNQQSLLRRVNAVFKNKLTLDPCGWQHEQDLIISSKPIMSALMRCQKNRTLKSPKTLGSNKI
jgi:hypothetical protein